MPDVESRPKAAVFQAILPQLEAEGYDVIVHPSRTMLPPFLAEHQPDAIAFRGDRKLAIEVAPSGGSTEPKLQRLREVVARHPDWELRVFYAPLLATDAVIPVSSRQAIEDHLSRTEKAFDAIGPAAALLIGWSAFEAAARSLIPGELARPQTPARLLETLASDGTITPDEADTLRRLGRFRNEAAHGRLDLPLTRQDLHALVRVTRAMLEVDEGNVPVGASG